MCTDTSYKYFSIRYWFLSNNNISIVFTGNFPRVEFFSFKRVFESLSASATSRCVYRVCWRYNTISTDDFTSCKLCTKIHHTFIQNAKCVRRTFNAQLSNGIGDFGESPYIYNYTLLHGTRTGRFHVRSAMYTRWNYFSVEIFLIYVRVASREWE